MAAAWRLAAAAAASPAADAGGQQRQRWGGDRCQARGPVANFEKKTATAAPVVVEDMRRATPDAPYEFLVDGNWVQRELLSFRCRPRRRRC